jgi:hypothetical protein
LIDHRRRPDDQLGEPAQVLGNPSPHWTCCASAPARCSGSPTGCRTWPSLRRSASGRGPCGVVGGRVGGKSRRRNSQKDANEKGTAVHDGSSSKVMMATRGGWLLLRYRTIRRERRFAGCKPPTPAPDCRAGGAYGRAAPVAQLQHSGTASISSAARQCPTTPGSVRPAIMLLCGHCHIGAYRLLLGQ